MKSTIPSSHTLNRLHRACIGVFAAAASGTLLDASPVTLTDFSFENGAHHQTLASTSPGVDSGWWMNPAIYAGAADGVFYLTDAGASNGTQTMLLGYSGQLRAIEQTVSTTFSAASNYALTIRGRAISYAPFATNTDVEMKLTLFRGDTGAVIKEQAFVIKKGTDRDVTLNVSAGDIITTGAVGQNIGVRIAKSALFAPVPPATVSDIELRADNVRLEETPSTDAYQVVMQTGTDLSGWTPIEQRYVPIAVGELNYRLRIGDVTSTDLVEPGFENHAAATLFPATNTGTDGGWWMNTAIHSGSNGGMLYVNDASAGDGGSKTALLGFPAQLRSLEQTVSSTFAAGTDYTLTSFASAIAYAPFADNTTAVLTITLFRGDTGAAIKQQTFNVDKTSPGDKSLTVTAAEVATAGAVGKPIGVRLDKSALAPAVPPSVDGRIELRVDNVRLNNTPLPGVLGIFTETSSDTLNWTKAGQRNVTPSEPKEFYRLKISPLFP